MSKPRETSELSITCPACHRECLSTLDGRCIWCIQAEATALQAELDRIVDVIMNRHPETWARVGVTSALEEVRQVLEQGAATHPDPWQPLGIAHHVHKAYGHRARYGRCIDSGRHHRAHAIARDLFALQLELERECQEGRS
jgi:hypothetical protein